MEMDGDKVSRVDKIERDRAKERGGERVERERERELTHSW